MAKEYKSYSDKLRDPRWQKKRLEILSRDEFTCHGCWDKTKTLHVHHLDYLSGKEPWEYPDEYFLTLCEDCHELETVGRPIIESQLIKAFRLKLHNDFHQRCLVETLEKYDDASGLMYLAWDMIDRQNDVISVLALMLHNKPFSMDKDGNIVRPDTE